MRKVMQTTIDTTGHRRLLRFHLGPDNDLTKQRMMGFMHEMMMAQGPQICAFYIGEDQQVIVDIDPDVKETTCKVSVYVLDRGDEPPT